MEIINYENQKTIELMKKSVAQGATDAEFGLFVKACQATGLNPFKKEVWFIKVKGAVQIMTGINGYYAIANRHPKFDGIETEIVEENGKVIKAIARVYRKDRSRPMVAEAYMQEYAKNYGNWKTMPRVMIGKCAESTALRKAFPQEMNGTYTEEEMPDKFSKSAKAFYDEPTGQEVMPKEPEPSIDGEFEEVEFVMPDLDWWGYTLQEEKSVFNGMTLHSIYSQEPEWLSKKLGFLGSEDQEAVRNVLILINHKQFYNENVDSTDGLVKQGSDLIQE